MNQILDQQASGFGSGTIQKANLDFQKAFEVVPAPGVTKLSCGVVLSSVPANQGGIYALPTRIAQMERLRVLTVW
jgi:hypothetical protein